MIRARAPMTDGMILMTLFRLWLDEVRAAFGFAATVRSMFWTTRNLQRPDEREAYRD